MLRPTVDADAVLKKAASDIIAQGENLRAKVRDLTLRALQARELSLAGIKQVLRSVSDGVNTANPLVASISARTGASSPVGS